MSHTIIFQTKILDLGDGRVIHLSRQGCNNDTSGREKGVYSGKILTSGEFENFIRIYEDEETTYDVMQIGSRWVNYKGYAEHLRRMWKRAVTWDELKTKAQRDCKCRPYLMFLESVEVTGDNINRTFTPAEWDKVCYDYWIGYTISKKIGYAYDIEEIVSILKNNKSCEFHIAA